MPSWEYKLRVLQTLSDGCSGDARSLNEIAIAMGYKRLVGNLRRALKELFEAGYITAQQEQPEWILEEDNRNPVHITITEKGEEAIER